MASPVNTVRTLSDTKRAFYAQHQRPINAVYRRVVEELMVEMHLLSVNQHFKYNPLYALGVVTTYSRFMTGYLPESDISAIFSAICQAVDSSAEQYRQDAEALMNAVSGLSTSDLKQCFESAKSGGEGVLASTLSAIAADENYKYTRLIAVGLYTLVESIDPEVLADKDKRVELMNALSESIGLSGDKVEKDLELYRSNLDKLAQAQEVMKDIIEADRKKRDERAQAATQPKAAESSDDEVDNGTDSEADSKDEAQVSEPS